MILRDFSICKELRMNEDVHGCKLQGPLAR